MKNIVGRAAALSFLTIVTISTLNAEPTPGNQVTVKTRKQYHAIDGLEPAQDYEVKLLHELLPRQVNELGLRLRVRNLFRFTDEKPVNTVLFHGPPGLGKTQAAKLLARTGKTHFIELKATGMVTKWQGSAVEAFKKATAEADTHYVRTKETSTIFMDEFDAIGRDLDDAESSMVLSNATKKDALMEIWQFIENNANDPRYVFVFGTNHMKSLHKTFLSRFREEHIIEFKLPQEPQRKIAFEHYLKEENFSITTELNKTESEAKKTVDMLVKYSNSMSYRDIFLCVRSFKDKKSLNGLSDADIINALKYLQERDEHEFKSLEELITKNDAPQKKKVDAAIIAIHEKITGKSVTATPLTNKDLYEVLQKIKAKNGYSWFEEILNRVKKVNKNAQPFSELLYNSKTAIGLGAVIVTAGIAGYRFFVKPQINPNNDPNIDLLIEQKVALYLMRAGVMGAGAAGVAGATIAVNNGNNTARFNPETGNFCGSYG